jgi:extradiol dioxygenase family protein
MSIEGVTFCDLCGGVVGRYDIAPVRVDEDGHQVQLHLHNRHTDDCLAQMLVQLMDQYAPGFLGAPADASNEKSVQFDA